MSKGWITLSRKIQDCWIWQDKPFSKGQAWIDLLLSANHKNNKFLFSGELIEVERGSFITSELKLMNRWGWSKTKVRNFLTSLENDSMIAKKTDSRKTTITIVNYSVYQDSQTTEEPVKDHRKTSERLVKDTNNNDNNDNNENNDNKNIDYQQIADMYNNTCVSFPRISKPDKLSETRKKAIKARLNTYTVDDFKRLFEMAERSSFLKGANDRNWTATFDWLIKDSNMAKVLDGNYNNRKGVQNGSVGTNDGERKTEHENELYRLAKEAGINTDFEGFNL